MTSPRHCADESSVFSDGSSRHVHASSFLFGLNTGDEIDIKHLNTLTDIRSLLPVADSSCMPTTSVIISDFEVIFKLKLQAIILP